MRKLLFIILVALFILGDVYATPLYNYRIIKVTDGDTVLIEAPFLPAPLKPEIGLRIIGVDTPEKNFRSHCTIEDNLAHKATDFTKNQIQSSKTYQVVIKGKDKYFRLLGDVIIDGKSLSKLLIDNGFAREYHGEAKKSWCNP